VGALAVAVLLIAQPLGGDQGVRWLVGTPLSVLAGVLFLVGLAPPRPLRAWWRRRGASRWQRMQASLIAAVTPAEVAQVVAPIVADDLGAGVVVIGPAGRVLARARVAAADAEVAAERLAAGLPLDDRDRVVPLDRSWMVVRSSPYTPLLGQDEHAMAEAYALQLRLGLERAELFEAHRRALREGDRSRRELEATLEGIATSLQEPTRQIGGAVALLRETRDEGRRVGLLDDIEQHVDEARQVVAVLLELSRIGRTHLEAEPLDLRAIIDEVTARLVARHPRFSVTVTSPLPVVWANPVRLSQLFDQLLRNAAEHGGRPDVAVAV
jgi:signal transduction histidine kinase